MSARVSLLINALRTPTKVRTSTRSEQLFEDAQKSLIEGVNSPSRGAAVYSPAPVFLERGPAPTSGMPTETNIPTS